MMKRMAFVDTDGKAAIDPQALQSGEAALRLKRFEDFWEHLLNRQKQIPAELEALRAENKAKTYRFRELMTEEMTDKMALDMLALFDMKE